MPPEFNILAYEDTPLGVLCLKERELLFEPGTLITEVTLNNEFLMSSYNVDSERALSSIAIAMHGGGNLKVLVGGLGLGYTADEALASKKVAQVEAVEFLPQVLAWLKEGLFPLAKRLSSDLRFDAVEGDVYARLAQQPKRTHDLILIDVDHSPDETLGKESSSFYSQEGLISAKRHLAPGGILGVWSYAESPAFTSALRQVFGEVRVEKIVFDNRLVGKEETHWLFFARAETPRL